MIGIISENNHAAFNLATEEILLKKYTDDIFFLYRDKPSIIVGKHQNTYAEINYQSVLQNNLEVFRRLSGGGTVYHDEGNLNFCFITNGQANNLINFKTYTSKIVDALKSLDINAELGGRNDILIEGKKISGNASHIYKNRVMHHGTLLFKSDLSILGNSLKTDPGKYLDKAVKSVRSQVTNISNHLSKPLTLTEFQSHLINEVLKSNNIQSLQQTDREDIQKLITEKYSTWQWNFGYSPEYIFKRRIKINQTQIILQFKVHKGIISEIDFQMSNKDSNIENCFKNLTGSVHQIESINNAFIPLVEKDILKTTQEITLQLF